MSVPLPPGDPARRLLKYDEFGCRIDQISTTVYRDGCYICEDPEFAQLGLPFCYPCRFCGGHCQADDSVCDDCDKDQTPDPPLWWRIKNWIKKVRGKRYEEGAKSSHDENL